MEKKQLIKIDFVNEFEIKEKVKIELNNLLSICFTDTIYNERTYFKQLPHYRLIMKLDNKVIGQLGIDYRVMNLNGNLIKVFGVIDLAVHPNFQKRGFGINLMKELELIAIKNKQNIDFLFLTTDNPLFYEKIGYIKTINKVDWLKIDQGKNYGLGSEVINDSILMFKKIGIKNWKDGELDMLGYWY